MSLSQEQQKSEREAFKAELVKMPEWAPEFEQHRAWGENFAWNLWQARASMLRPIPEVEGWISVHDRLPELPIDNEDDGVKVYTWDGEFVTEDTFEPTYEQVAGPAVGGWLRVDDWFCSDTAGRVTHWMLRRTPSPPSNVEPCVHATAPLPVQERGE